MDYNQKKERNPMLYVAPDGNYGNAEGLVQVDNESFDEHFYNYLDDCEDWLRPSFAEWFGDNDHDFEKADDLSWACSVCEDWIDWAKS